MRKEDYDEEPVVYCARCYSLNIRHDEDVSEWGSEDYCGNCGCSDVVSSSIQEWEELYSRRYGKKFVEVNTDPRKTFIFKLSIDKLKKRVFEDPEWREIVWGLYPHFPRNLNRAESVLFLFDKLIHDHRMDDLRLLLVKRFKDNIYGREEVKKRTQGKG
jgi:hypothetical protein